MLRLESGEVLSNDITRHFEIDTEAGIIIDPKTGTRYIPAVLDTTNEACVECERAGNKTNGGYTPRLKRRRSSGYVGCITHGDSARLTGHEVISNDGEELNDDVAIRIR